MRRSLGFDTSNYTTSVAYAGMDEYVSKRQILDVKKGERGLRQNDALFLHTKNIPSLIDGLDINRDELVCISVSDKPRDAEGSYMPCFLSGVSCAYSVGKAMNLPVYTFSHQSGHIMAACMTCGDKSLVNREFLAYHLSGGTTELVHVIPDKEKGFKTEIIGGTKDLSCGQIIDRCGVYLGFEFPCGNGMEKKMNGNLESMKVKTDDGYFNLSGIENKCLKLIEDGRSEEDIISFVFSYCANVIVSSVSDCLKKDKYRDLPVLFAGGVMRNNYIRSFIEKEIENAKFGSIELSSDNAVGIAWLGLYKEGGMLG